VKPTGTHAVNAIVGVLQALRGAYDALRDVRVLSQLSTIGAL
jgi:hypothetical protein